MEMSITVPAFFLGLWIGGSIGVLAMCLVQISHSGAWERDD